MRHVPWPVLLLGKRRSLNTPYNHSECHWNVYILVSPSLCRLLMWLTNSLPKFLLSINSTHNFILKMSKHSYSLFPLPSYRVVVVRFHLHLVSFTLYFPEFMVFYAQVTMSSYIEFTLTFFLYHRPYFWCLKSQTYIYRNVLFDSLILT